MGCKKEKLGVITTNLHPTLTISKLSTIDFALLHARDLYLWYNQIPLPLFTSGFTDLGALMESIRHYSIESGFSASVDRWSFTMKKTEWDKLSSGISANFSNSNEVAGDFGISVFFQYEGDLRVRMVEPESPGGRAGIRRGCRVMSINGNTSMTTSNASFIINSLYQSATVNLELERPDRSVITIVLAAAGYNTHPVFMHTVYDNKARKIGYFVYNSFLGKISETKADLFRIFNRYSSKGIIDLVIDLRYKGGGYVSLQEELANYLVSVGASGSLMMKQQYNDKNASMNSTTNFQKKGSLNLKSVKFIVSKSTASASELLINNLRPYMDIQLVGPSSTHGKPVGYFPVPVGDWYVFPVSFRTINKYGQGNYFGGFPINSAASDGVDKDWGDVTENCLAKALQDITGDTFNKQSGTLSEPDTKVIDGNVALDEYLFKGAIS